MQPLWHALGRPRLVYRVTDRNWDYPNQPAGLRAMERELAGAADLVIYTGNTLDAYVADLAPKASLCIGNGVEVAHFAELRELPTEYRTIPGPRAVFVGTIAEWFDEDVMVSAARALPQVSFVVIGPGAATLTRLSKMANVHFLGTRPYATIPAYLQHADVGLIPFRRRGQEAFVDNINPLKLYEYMAAGLRVVSTSFRQIRELQSPATIAEDDSAFVSAIAALTQQPAIGTTERDFAHRFDWAHQFAPLAAHLGI